MFRNTHIFYFCKKIEFMKHGLVLEGGGMRGLFTEGFLNVLMEHGLVFDGMIGVSAGALFGCGYKSHQPQRGLKCNTRFIGDKEYMSFRTLLKTGNLSSPEYAYHTVPTEIEPIDAETFEKDAMEFYVVCTDIEQGIPVYKKLPRCDYEGLEWFRATASMPLVSTPVELDGKKLLDGGMTDSVPLRYFQSIGYEKNIVVLTQPHGYRKKASVLNNIFRMTNRKYPQIAEAMLNRHKMYNSEMEYIESEVKKGNTFVVYPDEKLNIGRIEQNADKMHHVYELGRRKAKESLPQIIKFLE